MIVIDSFEILLLKFFKEILCNPFVILSIFDWSYELVDGIINLITKLFPDNVSKIHIQEFIYLANYFGYNDLRYEELWINKFIDHTLCQIIRIVNPLNDAELINQLFSIKNAKSIKMDSSLHDKYRQCGSSFTMQSYVDSFEAPRD